MKTKELSPGILIKKKTAHEAKFENFTCGEPSRSECHDANKRRRIQGEWEYKACKEGKRKGSGHMGRHKKEQKHKSETALEKVERVEGTCEGIGCDSANPMAEVTRIGICIE